MENVVYGTVAHMAAQPPASAPGVPIVVGSLIDLNATYVWLFPKTFIVYVVRCLLPIAYRLPREYSFLSFRSTKNGTTGNSEAIK